MREGGERKNGVWHCKGRTELEIGKSHEDKFVNKKWVPRKWCTSIGFRLEPILWFLMEVEVEVEVEAHFDHTKDTNG